jgi:hypothetical protein
MAFVDEALEGYFKRLKPDLEVALIGILSRAMQRNRRRVICWGFFALHSDARGTPAAMMLL